MGYNFFPFTPLLSPGEVRVWRAGRARSADLPSAVSQVFNLPNAACEQRSADYKSAIQQIKNLRYGN